MPSSLIWSLRDPNGRRYPLPNPMARRSSGTWSMRSIGSSPSHVTRPKRSSVVRVLIGRVERLPSSAAVGAVIHDQERHAPSEGRHCPLGAGEGPHGTPRTVEGTRLPSAVHQDVVRHVPGWQAADRKRNRLRLAVAEEEQPPPRLRHSESGGVENLREDVVAQPFEVGNQRVVPVPAPHVDHVLDHDPAGVQVPREVCDVMRCILAPLVTGARALGAGVVGAFGRGEGRSRRPPRGWRGRTPPPF